MCEERGLFQERRQVCTQGLGVFWLDLGKALDVWCSLCQVPPSLTSRCPVKWCIMARPAVSRTQRGTLML